VSRWLNCGTLLALLGVLVFVILGIAVFQILCHGAAGEPGSGWMRFPD
jgi:ABC-type antimicrobial peptide transport system permease subunit